VLEHEEDVEDEAEEAKPELGGVAEEGDPVVVVVRVERHLQHRQRPAHEVQEDVADGPAYSRLALVVHVRLETIKQYLTYCLSQRDNPTNTPL
jgi:hypothetical protein